MFNFKPFPYFLNNAVNNGFLIKAENFCKNINNKCYSFYKKLDSKGFYECPFGFTTYINDDKIIFTGLRIYNHYNKKKIKYKIKNDFNPKLTEEQFFSIILEYDKVNSSYKEDHNKLLLLTNKIKEIEIISKENSNFINQTLHEIRKLNSAIKLQSEQATKNIEKSDIENIKNRIKNIFATSSLISIRLNSYDFTINPEIFNETKQIEIYKKFEKISHCLEVSFSEKKLKHSIVGTSYVTLDGYDIFELLPFLLLENAIKYSPKELSITTKFITNDEFLKIEIISTGPVLEEFEKEKIFEKNYRGVNTQFLNTSGTGSGLYLAKKICDLHNINIKAKSLNDSSFSIGNIKYSSFVIEMNFMDVKNN